MDRAGPPAGYWTKCTAETWLRRLLADAVGTLPTGETAADACAEYLRYIEQDRVSDATFERVERAARRLGVSRSEFFARAAERWLDDLYDDGATEAINRAITGVPEDTAFTDAAAAALAETDERA